MWRRARSFSSKKARGRLNPRLGTRPFNKGENSHLARSVKAGKYSKLRTEESMFCPSCGFEYTQKTNYCKSCGADLSPAGSTVAPKKTHLGVGAMFWGIIAFCLTGATLLLTAVDHFQRTGRCNGMCDAETVLLVFVGGFFSLVTLLLIW